jgi:hypothetical protein
MNPENMRKNFLDELENHDYVGSVNSVIDGRQKIYYPLIELDRSSSGCNENDSNDHYIDATYIYPTALIKMLKVLFCLLRPLRVVLLFFVVVVDDDAKIQDYGKTYQLQLT